MIQFNLLPDVKLEYVKAQRIKRLMTLISIIVSIVALFVLMMSIISVDVVQKKSLRNLDSDVSKYTTQLKSVKDLDKILTVQNQLSTLTGLHDKKPVTDRIFTYLTQTTPTQASLDKLTIDFSANSVAIGGKAPSLDTVSAFTDTLKAAQYTVAGSSTKTQAFSQVTLTSFSRGDSGATFTINYTFDPALFDSSKTVTLVVPTKSNAGQSNIFGTGN